MDAEAIALTLVKVLEEGLRYRQHRGERFAVEHRVPMVWRTGGSWMRKGR